MGDTKQAVLKDLESLIRRICTIKHSSSTLPDSPWFTKSGASEQAVNLLTTILFQNNNRTPQFASKAAAALLQFEEEKENAQVTRAVYLQENVKMRKAYNALQEDADKEPSRISLVVFKAQSGRFGPITTSVDCQNVQKFLEERDSVTLNGSLEDSANVEFFVRDGDDMKKIGDKVVFFQAAIKDISYDTICQERNFSATIREEKADFSVVLELEIVVSNAERLGILRSHIEESEKQLEDLHENAAMFDELCKALRIRYSDGAFSSTVLEREHRRESDFCDACQLI